MPARRTLLTRYLDIRYESDGTLGLQFHAESVPPFAVARITPGSLTAAHPHALAGMVLVSIAAREVPPDADYGQVLNELRRSKRPLELRFRLPDVEEDEDDHPDGPVENEGVLRKLERDTSFHRGYTPHPRFFVLRADGLEYFRLFLAGVHGMGDTVTSGAGRVLPFSDMQAVVPGSDLPQELINEPPSAAAGADSPEAAGERPHWAVEDDTEDGGHGGGGTHHADHDDPFAQTFALSSPADRSLDLEPEPEQPGDAEPSGGGAGSGLGSARAGEECRFTIVMGDRYVGSAGYQKPWRLYRLQAGSASDRDAWLSCIRGGMARYREHGPWALRPRAGDRAVGGMANAMTAGAGAGAYGFGLARSRMAAMHVVSATVARTVTQDSTSRRVDDGGVARPAGIPGGTPRAASTAADDAVSDGSATESTLSLLPRPYTRYVVEYRTEANTHGEVARRFDEFRQLHAKVLVPVSSPAAPIVLPPAHQVTDILADKNDPELVAYRAWELQQYINTAVRLVRRLNAPPVRYALDHFLTYQGAGAHLEQLGGSRAVADMLSRQQLWDAVGHWRGEESAGLLGVTTTDAAGNVTGRRAPAWFGLNLDPDGSAELTIAHEGSLLAQLLGRWESCGGGRRLHLSLSGSGNVASDSDQAESDATSTSERGSSGVAATGSRGGSVTSYCSWGLELTWRKVCVENSGRSADTSREYTVYHMSCVQACVAERNSHDNATSHCSTVPSLGNEPEPKREPERRWIVSARYSAFVSLRDLLLGSADRSLSAEIALLDELFPPKESAAAWIMPRSTTLGAERQAGLLGWLRAVHRTAPQHPAVLAFLAPPQTKSNSAFGDHPYSPHDPECCSDSHNGGHNQLYSIGSSLPADTSWSSQDGTGSSFTTTGGGAAGAVSAAGAARGRSGSDEFVMPGGDDDVYANYPDNNTGTTAQALGGRGLVRTISSIGIQGLNTPRAAEAVAAGAAAAAVAPASPASHRVVGIIGTVDGSGETTLPALATADPASLISVGHAAPMKLSIESAGPPTVHNAGVAWSDSFGNAVERRRLVLETCLQSDGVVARRPQGGGGTNDGDDLMIWKHYAEGEVSTLFLFHPERLMHHSSAPSICFQSHDLSAGCGSLSSNAWRCR